MTAQCWQKPSLHSGYCPFSLLTPGWCDEEPEQTTRICCIVLGSLPWLPFLPGSFFLLTIVTSVFWNNILIKQSVLAGEWTENPLESQNLRVFSFSSHCDLMLRSLKVCILSFLHLPLQFCAQKTQLMCSSCHQPCLFGLFVFNHSTKIVEHPLCATCCAEQASSLDHWKHAVLGMTEPRELVVWTWGLMWGYGEVLGAALIRTFRYFLYLGRYLYL